MKVSASRRSNPGNAGFVWSISPIPAPPAPPAFLPVTLRLTEHAPDEPLPIVAELPNGIRLRIPTANARLVCRLVRAVAGAKTDSGGAR